MRNQELRTVEAGVRILLVLFSAGLVSNPPVSAQNSEMQQCVAEIKTSAAKNKQSLAPMTWVEQITISLNGEQKKVERFQVRLGPDGKPQKTSLDPPAPPPEQSGRQGRVKKRVVEKKKEEYKDYADQMKTLSEQYLPPDKDLIEQASGKGITIATAGTPGEIQLIIRNYVKTQDSMPLVIDRERKQLCRVEIVSYLSDPKDAVTVTVQFAPVQDGSNQISSVVINDASKQLNIAVADADYRHL